jgi:MFS superfamily sulfate permease-like transporter
MLTNRQGHSTLPILDWILGYRKEWLRLDVIAGLTTAAVVRPKAMAYATIAGLPVLVGLNPEVLATVQRSSLGQALGRERMIFNLELAVARYLESAAAGSTV